MGKIYELKTIFKLMGREGIIVMLSSLIMTLGVINFFWVTFAPGTVTQKLFMFLFAFFGGILLFIFTAFLILTVLLPWMINKRVKRFFGPVIKINKEYERKVAQDESKNIVKKTMTKKKTKKAKGRRIKVE